MISKLLLIGSAVAVLSNVSAFTTSPMGPLATQRQQPSNPMVFGQQQQQQHQGPLMRNNKADLVGIVTRSSATADNNGSGGSNGTADNAMTSKMIEKLEREEAKINKQRQKAMEKLNKYEASLTKLQSKKQEYLNGDSLSAAPPGGNFSETTTRSAVKALLWRVIAGSVTFVTSLRFSGSVMTALSIVGSDFFSKAFTMFIGERLMNKSQAGRKSGSDGAGRSLAKALIWRLFAIANTLTMAIFISKDLSVASKIASTDAVFKTALMYFYERAWARIEWGKEYQVEYYL